MSHYGAIKLDMKKNTLWLLIILIVVLIIAGYFFTISRNGPPSSSMTGPVASSTITTVTSSTASSSAAKANPVIKTSKETQTVGTTTVVYQPQTSFDPSSIEQLIQNSDIVFVGTVKQREVDVPGNRGNSPSFFVQDVVNIKAYGSKGSFLVQADIAYQGNRIYIAKGDAALDSNNDLLQVGSTYLFAVSPENGLESISLPPYDRVLITTVSTSTRNLINIIGENPTYQEFVRATAALGETYHFQESFQ